MSSVALTSMSYREKSEMVKRKSVMSQNEDSLDIAVVECACKAAQRKAWKLG